MTLVSGYRSTTSPIKDAGSQALIINFSGHTIPDCVFTYLKKEKEHKRIKIYNSIVHVDVDKNLTEQVEILVDDLINNSDLTTIRGLKYYIGCSHKDANLLIFLALSSLFGVEPLLIVNGKDIQSFNRYEYKQAIDVRSWKGKWRSIKRREYNV